MIHFLELHGILDAVLKAAAVALVGTATRAVRAHIRDTRDKLDPSTPGGLGEVTARLDRLEREMEKKPAPRARTTKAKPRPDGEGRG